MFKRKRPFIQVDSIEGIYCTQWRLEELIRVAEEIGDFYELATDFHVYYDPNQDYHCLSFKIGESQYIIHYYKVFAMSVNGNDYYSDTPPRKNFGHSAWTLVRFVKSPDFLTWSLEEKKSSISP